MEEICLFVNVFTMANIYYKNSEDFIFHMVNDPVVAIPDSVAWPAG